MSQKGFTLIELMIVVAIIGILAMFAMTSYQDYTRRTYISEGIGLASRVKFAVTEYYSANGTWPIDNAMAGLDPSLQLKSVAVDSITVQPNAGIIIVYNEKVTGRSGTTATLGLQGFASGGAFIWQCGKNAGIAPSGIIDPLSPAITAVDTTVVNRILPTNCR